MHGNIKKVKCGLKKVKLCTYSGKQPSRPGSLADGHTVGVGGYGVYMDENRSVTVRMFGLLYSARRAAGLPTTVDLEVPAEGITAREVAVNLDLDLAVIEGVFVNRTVYDLEHLVRPGDRVAFVPQGTPGPHRFFLGLFKAGRAGAEDGFENTD